MSTARPAMINMFSDGLGEFTRALGLDQDLSERGRGMRSKRYAMLIDVTQPERITFCGRLSMRYWEKSRYR